MLTLKQGDRKPYLKATLYGGDGTAINLTGHTVEVRISDPSGTVTTSSATLDDAANGQVSYAFQSGDTDTAGLYEYEWVVTFGSGEVLTAPGDDVLQFRVLEVLS